MNLEDISFEKLCNIYNKLFSLGYINSDVSEKLALISLTCYITSTVRKKGKNMTCYEVLLNLGKDLPVGEKNTFLKSLGAICENLMYGCDTFPDFNIKPSEMPNTIRGILGKYCPF